MGPTCAPFPTVMRLETAEEARAIVLTIPVYNYTKPDHATKRAPHMPLVDSHPR